MKPFYKCTQKQQIERWEQVWRVLNEMTPHERRSHWDMGTFGRYTECGTVACAAGRCSFDPWFQRRGFSGTVTEFYGWSLKDVVDSFETDAVAEFFGLDGANRIFFNGSQRPVSKVMREVKSHIAQLRKYREEGDYEI